MSDLPQMSAKNMLDLIGPNLSLREIARTPKCNPQKYASPTYHSLSGIRLLL